MCHLSDSAQSYLNYADSAPDVIEKEKCCGCGEEYLPEELKGYAHKDLGKSGRFCEACIDYDTTENSIKKPNL